MFTRHIGPHAPAISCGWRLEPNMYPGRVATLIMTLTVQLQIFHRKQEAWPTEKHVKQFVDSPPRKIDSDTHSHLDLKTPFSDSRGF